MHRNETTALEHMNIMRFTYQEIHQKSPDPLVGVGAREGLGLKLCRESLGMRLVIPCGRLFIISCSNYLINYKCGLVLAIATIV